MHSKRPSEVVAGRTDGMLPGLSRRRFLRWGVGGLAGLTAIGGAAVSLRGCGPDVEGLKVLSGRQHRTANAIAETLIPKGGAFPQGATDYDFGRVVDSFLAGEPACNVADLTMALTLFEVGPALFERRLWTFSGLPPDEREAHFEAWMTSDSLTRRKVALGFRKLMLLVFYDQPEVWPQIGYGGPSV